MLCPEELSSESVLNMETRKAASGQGAVFVPNPKLKLLEQIREVCRLKHYSLRTEQTYVAWVKRFLWFHKKQAGHWRHPRDLGGPEVSAFLSHLASVEKVGASTQNQALNAVVFL